MVDHHIASWMLPRLSWPIGSLLVGAVAILNYLHCSSHYFRVSKQSPYVITSTRCWKSALPPPVTMEPLASARKVCWDFLAYVPMVLPDKLAKLTSTIAWGSPAPPIPSAWTACQTTLATVLLAFPVSLFSKIVTCLLVKGIL